MSEPRKVKSFCIEEQKTILVQGDADKEMHFALAALFGHARSTLCC